MRLEKEYKKNAKIHFEKKEYQDCLKSCFACMSINPFKQWIYDLCGYSYMHIGMWSQSRGSFSTAKSLESEENKIKNYNKLIELCHAKEKEQSSN